MRIEYEFSDIVSKYSDRNALISDREGVMTYQQLDIYSDQIANHIQKYVDKHERYLGVYMRRSFKMIATIIGIIKSGRGYIPIDIEYPIERVRTMIHKSNINVLLVDEIVDELVQDVKILKVSKDIDQEKKYFDFHNCKEITDIACVIFTSGSTGKPDCVMMSHTSILNTVHWAIKFYALGENDVDLQVPSCSYTSSVQDIFSTLLSGGCLVMVQQADLLNMRRLTEICRKYKVTHFDMVPSLYREFLNAFDGDNLRFVLLAGETLKIDLTEKHYKKFPNVKIVNEYGMAETCSCFSYYIVPKRCHKVLIGQPIDNMGYRINNPDEDGIGELWAFGVGLSAGYLDDIEKTKAKFVELNGQYYLKTGDYVRCLEDGNLEYIGRKDNQIKINGRRVNLLELDNFMLNNNLAVESVSIAVNVCSKSEIMMIYKGGYSIEEIKNILQREFPQYFVPTYIFKTENIEYLPNKKINVKKMKEYYLEKILLNTTIYQEKYKIIYDILEKIVKVPADFSEKDDLREVMDSISMIEMLALCEEKFHCELEYEDVIKTDKCSIEGLYKIFEGNNFDA